MKTDCDILVIGGGPCGLTTALALKQAGFTVGLADAAPLPRPAKNATVKGKTGAKAAGKAKGKTAPTEFDGRSAALLPASVDFLDHLGVWKYLAAQAAPLRALNIAACGPDGQTRSQTRFAAEEAGHHVLAYNIANEALTAALRTKAAKRGGPTLFHGRRLTDLAVEAGAARAIFAKGKAITARLIIAADGGDSAVRKAAGIKAPGRGPEKAAVVCALTPSHPPDDVCTEFHLNNGPLTLTPLGPDRLALVWVEKPDRAQALLEASDEDFLADLTAIAGDVIGHAAPAGPRRLHPIRPQLAERLTGPRLALAGEAAHVLPPTGAQGLNLSLADARILTECLSEARALGSGDPGAAHALADYARRRKRDMQVRSWASRALNRWASAGNPVEAALRAGATRALEYGGAAVKRRLMQAGLDS